MKTLKAPLISSPEPAHWLYTVCQTPSKRRTDEETRLFVRPSVRSFVSLSIVFVKGVHPIGGTNRDASQKFKGGHRIRDQPLNTRRLVS